MHTCNVYIVKKKNNNKLIVIVIVTNTVKLELCHVIVTNVKIVICKDVDSDS